MVFQQCSQDVATNSGKAGQMKASAKEKEEILICC